MHSMLMYIKMQTNKQTHPKCSFIELKIFANLKYFYISSNNFKRKSFSSMKFLKHWPPNYQVMKNLPGEATVDF